MGEVTSNKDIANHFSLGRSPINLTNIKNELCYYDHEDSFSILQGFKTGFFLHYSGPREYRFAKKLKSCNVNPGIIAQKLKKNLMQVV